MMLHTDQINELATALSKAQGQIKSAEKDGTNPHFKSHYSTLDSVWEALRDPLSKNGLSISQTLSCENEMIILTTILMHSSGQWIKSSMPIIRVTATPQAIGSACTYMKRYSLAAIAGVTSGEDDDGNEAEKNHTPPRPAPKKIPPPSPPPKEVSTPKKDFCVPFGRAKRAS
jgi:ERF superfamily.